MMCSLLDEVYTNHLAFPTFKAGAFIIYTSQVAVQSTKTVLSDVDQISPQSNRQTFFLLSQRLNKLKRLHLFSQQAGESQFKEVILILWQSKNHNSVNLALRQVQ